MQISNDEFSLLKSYLHDTCGIDVPPEKSYLFVTRLAGLLSEIGCSSFSEFYHRINSGNDLSLRARLVEAMTTNETAFFRDAHPFQTLQNKVLPALAGRRRAESRYLPRLRIWSVGCSTGEEAYSIAMAVSEWLASQQAFTRNQVSIVAMDISGKALSVAKRGLYSESQLGDRLPGNYRQSYFHQIGGGWMVREDVRAMVLFNELNLAEPFEHLGCFDVIFCRNVIIYFSLELKKRIIEQFYRMLQPGGVLFMGASENLYNISSSFKTRYEEQTIYYLKEG
jgi:chemotaxis protein methyltransferase CheR